MSSFVCCPACMREAERVEERRAMVPVLARAFSAAYQWRAFNLRLELDGNVLAVSCETHGTVVRFRAERLAE